jgi:hypothetical protein
LLEEIVNLDPTEEYSTLLVDPVLTELSVLKGKYKLVFSNDLQIPQDLNEYFVTQVPKETEYEIKFELNQLLTTLKPVYKVEVDFPRSALYQQCYIMSVLIKQLREESPSDYEVIIQEGGNWLIFGKTRYTISFEKEKVHDLTFNLIPINVGEIALPILNILVKKPKEAPASGQKQKLLINLESDGPEIASEKFEFKYVNSRTVQVFNNSTVNGELFSFVDDI